MSDGSSVGFHVPCTNVEEHPCRRMYARRCQRVSLSVYPSMGRKRNEIALNWSSSVAEMSEVDWRRSQPTFRPTEESRLVARTVMRATVPDDDK